MDESTERYPVCPDRNTPAAFRWFFQPLNLPAFLKGRPAARPSSSGFAASQTVSGRAPEGG